MAFFNKYPYTDYHQLNLSWFLEKFAEDKIDYTYIKDYFENLDVSDEVKEVLDEMVDDGTLGGLIDDYLPAIVTTWLAAHITNPSNPPLDTSLTIGNAAADAQATGDAIKMAIRSLNLTLTTSNVPSTYPDLKSFQNGSMIAVTNSASQILTDSPYNNVGYYVMTGKVGAASSTGMHFQIALPYNSNIHLMAVRTENLSDQSYSSWQYLYKQIMPSASSSDDKRDIITFHISQNKHVILPPGDFYLDSPITLVDGCILEGSGAATRLIVKHKTGDFNYGILMQGNNMKVCNLTLMGDVPQGDNPATSPATEYVYGINWSSSSSRGGVVESCWFTDFDRAGILCIATGTSTNAGLLINDCIFRQNYDGLLISRDSEYHRVSNCKFIGCHYGILNRGGNNNFVNCGLDYNTVGIQSDADSGSNNGHGQICNCTINHSQPNNTGDGIVIKDAGGNMLIANNNIYYSNVVFDNADCNIFNNNNLRHGNITMQNDSDNNLMIGNIFASNSHFYLDATSTCVYAYNITTSGGSVTPE